MKIAFITLPLVASVCLSTLAQPIKLHKDNPHYFDYKGKPTVLITSGEHYGAVVNMDFDYVKYLQTLKKEGFNHTRLFLGDYVENVGAFCIVRNTLAPAPGRFLAPWMRSNTPGFAYGGNKFDLDKWNPEYFKRLKGFFEEAQKNDIVVEAVLFFVGPGWEAMPMNPKNNINKTTDIKNTQYMTLNNGNILKYQEAYCRKIVNELNGFDNVIFNVANEPWFINQEIEGFSSPPANETKEWIERVSEWIKNEESKLGKTHILSVDYANEGKAIKEEYLKTYFKNISVFNHHYDKNAESLALNYHLPVAITFNETGLMHAISPQYRMQGWKYMLSGGALYNNLDFTFQVGTEDGTGSTEYSCDWYNGSTFPQVRMSIRAIKNFMESIDFINMRPLSAKDMVECHGDEKFTIFGKENFYVIYLQGSYRTRAYLKLKDGNYKFTYINPIDGNVIMKNNHIVKEGKMNFLTPEYQEDILIKIEKM